MGMRFSAPVQTGPGAHPPSCTKGTGSFPGVKSGRGVTLTPHPLPVPWSRKSRAIPLLSLRAVRPVQSLSACTTVHCTFTFIQTSYLRVCRESWLSVVTLLQCTYIPAVHIHCCSAHTYRRQNVELFKRVCKIPKSDC